MKMHHLLIALPLLFGSVASASTQISVGIALPGVQIGINMPTYPQLVLVPGYPVYYAPRAPSNYFFYDGMYWVYEDDNWYASSWYNGPWLMTEPEYVPVFILRIPVRYYRHQPVYFRGWRPDAPPRWGDHWGRDWEARRGGWDRWDRRAAPRAAPLPVYQRQYSGTRYPRTVERQHVIRSEKYRYQPRDAVTKQHFQQRGVAANQRTEPQQQQSVRQRPPAEQQRPQQEHQRQRDEQQVRPNRQAPQQATEQQREERPRQEQQRHRDEQQARPNRQTPQQVNEPQRGERPRQEQQRQREQPQSQPERQHQPMEQQRGERSQPERQDKGRDHQDRGRENKNGERGQGRQ